MMKKIFIAILVGFISVQARAGTYTTGMRIDTTTVTSLEYRRGDFGVGTATDTPKAILYGTGTVSGIKGEFEGIEVSTDGIVAFSTSSYFAYGYDDAQQGVVLKFTNDGGNTFNAVGSGSGSGPFGGISPIGTTLPVASTGTYPGFLYCDGTSYSTQVYSSLFNVIGYQFGGSGANFNVPDYTAETPEYYIKYTQAYDLLHVLGYVDRGDPANYDFPITSLSQDANWHDLDVSTIVPEGAKAVALMVQITDAGTGDYFMFRKKGNTGTRNYSIASVNAGGVYFYYDLVVPLNDDRIIEYSTQGGTGMSGNIEVKGWWYGSDIDSNIAFTDSDEEITGSWNYSNSQATMTVAGYIDNSQVLQGWIVFSSTTTPITIFDSYNVSSVADHGGGAYTVNWQIPFANNEYVVTTGVGNRIVNAAKQITITDIDINGVKISTWDRTGSNGETNDYISIMAIGTR